MAASVSLKDRISSPLEAGVSVADGHQLPGRLTAALEYASTRLSRKAANITLLVIQRDYQLPTLPLPSSYSASSSMASPVWYPSSAAAPPVMSTRPAFATSAISSLKQLIRSNNTTEAPIRERIVHICVDQLRNETISPAFSDVSTASTSTAFTADSSDSVFSNRLASWPASPSCPSLPMTPATPFTIASSTTDTGSAVSGPGLQKHLDQFATRLVYVGQLSPRDERVLNQTLEKTARKFKIGFVFPPLDFFEVGLTKENYRNGWLSNAASPESLGLPPAVAQRSLEQGEALFTSKSLTVLSLDHLYTFRTSLQSYARTQSPCRLEDAVDELRRLILANGRRKLLKSTLLTSYRWLDPVSESALADVLRMYGRGYGGIEGESGVENDIDPLPEWPLTNDEIMPPQFTECPRSPCYRVEERETDVSRTPPPSQPPSLASTPQQSRGSHHRWSMGDEKEIFGGLLNLELDDNDLEIDAIEAWYRDVQLPPVEIQPVEIEVEEVRQGTPKIAPAPIGRNLALRLQTTFEKPKRILTPEYGTPQSASLPQQPPKTLSLQQEQRRIVQLTTDGEDDDLTARPVSVIVSKPPMGWNSMSIDGVLNSAHPDRESNRNGFGLGHSLVSPTSPTSPQHLGPLTPNGYDDISPITRNEWGFITQNLPKTAAVEMC